MVRAGSLKYGNSFELIKKIAAGVMAFALISGIGFGVYSAFSGDSGESIVAPTSTTLPKDISEEVLGREYPVSQPGAVPTNFVRTKVEIISGTRSKSGCEEILQNYQGSQNPEEAFIDIYSYASGCNYSRPADATSFNIGDYAGWISDPDSTPDTSDDGLTLLIEITVNQAPVRIESDLPITQLSGVIETFVPFSNNPPEDSVKITVS